MRVIPKRASVCPGFCMPMPRRSSRGHLSPAYRDTRLANCNCRQAEFRRRTMITTTTIIVRGIRDEIMRPVVGFGPFLSPRVALSTIYRRRFPNLFANMLSERQAVQLGFSSCLCLLHRARQVNKTSKKFRGRLYGLFRIRVLRILS